MNKHAVVLDDNKDNVNVLAELLALEGVAVTTLGDSNRFFAALAGSAPIDVIFLDLEMPGLNGYQILQALKTDVRYQAIPVVAYTVHVSEIHAARKLGFAGFIGKPLDADAFPKQLARILAGESVWAVS